MRVGVFAIWLLAAPALAEAPAPIVVAPAGVCAGEERDLAPPPLAGPDAEEDAALALPAGALLHLTPASVASDVPLAASAAPALPIFEGPGACDNPGSGCVREVVEDPDPGSGCGFPGSPCP